MTAIDRTHAVPATGRPADYVTKELDMHLIHEELARSHSAERRREAEERRRALHVAAARRWQRRAEAAGRRARHAAALASR